MATAMWEQLCDAVEAPRYRFGTQRASTPTETLKRITPLLAQAGITRLADVTGLDWIGMPVYQAIRPNSRNISVSQGKGLTRAQAKVSALMESLESFHAEELHLPSVWASVGDMRRQVGYDICQLSVVSGPPAALERDLDFDAFAPPLGGSSLLHEGTLVEWIPATDLITGQQSWVPRELCELNFCVEPRWCPPLFRATSNGLASGNTIAEAVVHGLCEVIERDSLWRTQDAPCEVVIEPASVNAPLPRSLLARFTTMGMSVHIVDATGPTGVPCFVAYLSHVDSPGRYFGAGCHPNAATALVRALTEAAQSRLGHIAGSRDDLFRRSYLGGTEWRSEVTEVSSRMKRWANDGLRVDTWRDAVRELTCRIMAVTGMAPLAVDLWRSEFALPVTMVVAPGLRLVPPSRR